MRVPWADLGEPQHDVSTLKWFTAKRAISLGDVFYNHEAIACGPSGQHIFGCLGVMHNGRPVWSTMDDGRTGSNVFYGGNDDPFW
jgi:hypothetical protein